MPRITFFASLLIAYLLCVPAWSQQVAQAPLVEYTVTLDQPQTQMVNISMLVRQARGETIEFMLPIWRPGRYYVLNQAGTLRDVKAFGEREQPLHIDKIDKSTWRVTLNGSKWVRVEYRVYANSLGDRMKHVDDTHAFLDGAAVFMYTNESRKQPCVVRINKPKEWRIACGLNRFQDDPSALAAANYDVLVDSPLEIGIHDMIDFMAAGKPHQIVIWGAADYKADDVKRDFTKIIEEETKIFGSAPYQRYVFLTHVGAGAGGGTEHINSTIMQTSRAALEDPQAYQRFLGLVSHEFFHTWNIKSFRPAGLHPYDYQHENYTPLLWVAEGTTSYYSPLVLVRAGFTQPTRYLQTLSDAIDSMRNKPGETVQSVEQASFDSWIQFNAHTPDDVNSTVNFYGKGALVSLLLDLEMRRRSDNRVNLDQAMRVLYERFPLSGKGYETADLKRIIEELSGADFTDIFEKNIHGAEPLGLENAFAGVGVELYFRPGADAARSGRAGVRAVGRETASDDSGAIGAEADAPADDAQSQPEARPETQPETQPAAPKVKAYLGLNLTDGTPPGSGKTTVSSVPSDGPAYSSGILAGDEIIALDGRRLTAATLDDRLRHLRPGQTVTLTYLRRDELRSAQITLTGKPEGRWTLRRMRNPTDAQKAAYESWLGRKW